MDLGLKGRTAVVLGSTGGLGAALARALGAEGANVVVTGRNQEKATRVAQSLPSAVAVSLDLADPEAVGDLLVRTRAAFGDPDIIVLNGPGPQPGPATGADSDALRSAISLLLYPQVDLVKETIGSMRKNGWGRILAVGSSGVASPLPMLAASNIGRASLASYLKTLATEVAADGVTVNMLLPGRIATDRVAALDAAKAERDGTPVDAVRAASLATIPAGRYGDPEEFGAVGAFLCSHRASYVTGCLVRCDGGLLRHL